MAPRSASRHAVRIGDNLMFLVHRPIVPAPSLSGKG